MAVVSQVYYCQIKRVNPSLAARLAELDEVRNLMEKVNGQTRFPQRVKDKTQRSSLSPTVFYVNATATNGESFGTYVEQTQ
jgi:hypothetical protein